MPSFPRLISSLALFSAPFTLYLLPSSASGRVLTLRGANTSRAIPPDSIVYIESSNHTGYLVNLSYVGGCSKTEQLCENLYSQTKTPNGREIFSPDDGKKSQEYFVYFKILSQNMAEKDSPRRCIEVVNTGS